MSRHDTYAYRRPIIGVTLISDTNKETTSTSHIKSEKLADQAIIKQLLQECVEKVHLEIGKSC